MWCWSSVADRWPMIIDRGWRWEMTIHYVLTTEHLSTLLLYKEQYYCLCLWNINREILSTHIMPPPPPHHPQLSSREYWGWMLGSTWMLIKIKSFLTCLKPDLNLVRDFKQLMQMLNRGLGAALLRVRFSLVLGLNCEHAWSWFLYQTIEGSTVLIQCGQTQL